MVRRWGQARQLPEGNGWERTLANYVLGEAQRLGFGAAVGITAARLGVQP